MNSGPAVKAKIRVQRRSLLCRPGTMKPQISESHSGEVPTMAAMPQIFSCSISGVPTPVITALVWVDWPSSSRAWL